MAGKKLAPEVARARRTDKAIVTLLAVQAAGFRLAVRAGACDKHGNRSAAQESALVKATETFKAACAKAQAHVRQI